MLLLPATHISPFSTTQSKMAQTIFTPFLILLLITILSSSSSLVTCRPSSSTNHRTTFQFLDVSASLKLTRQVFSPQKTHDNSFSMSTLDSNNDVVVNGVHFSTTIHPRASLHTHTHKNYTSLTLARLARDSLRVNSVFAVSHPNQLETPITSGAAQGSGEYFARLGVGQPGKESLMVIDTGSDVTWLQCEPCADCYHQSNAIYNPSTSSSYHNLPCSSTQCSALQISACSQSQTCLYQVSYGDGSSTSGNFATDTVSFGSSGSVPNVAIGCGHDNEGLFVGSDGLLGLGGGPLSLPSQIKANSFSYCLVNRDSSTTSTLEFNSAPPGDSVLAPLLKNSRINTYYYVGLAGFNVGGSPVVLPTSAFDIGGDGRGGVIVDSGTAVTRLRSDAYEALRDAFVSMSQDLRATDGFALFDTCYDFSGLRTVKVPTVALKFGGGETLALKPENYLIPVDDAGKHCFAFAPTSGQLSIIGNLQQQGTRVSYNLASRTVGFSPNKC